MKSTWTRWAAWACCAGAVAAVAVLGTGNGGLAAQDDPQTMAQNLPGKAQAESVHLFLKLNGTDIEGEPAQTSLGRENSIECLYFENAVKTAREAGSGMATGRRQYEPLTCRKRLDKSSPLLLKGLTENAVAQGVFRFYRPNPTGDGTIEQHYTIGFRNGRVNSYRLVSDPQQGEVEEVTFVFQTISWTYENGGVTHEDTWSNQR